MAKKPFKNLATMKQEAKTFHDLVAVIVNYYEKAISNLRSAQRREMKSDRPTGEGLIKSFEMDLKRLETRRQRYEQYQGNKKIPAALREEIADTETELLREEPGQQPWERESIRARKMELAELFEQVERLTNPPKSLTTTNKAFQVGKNYPSQSITRTYDGHVWKVLMGHVERLPRQKGQRTSFRIVAALPEKNEYLQLKECYFTKTLEALVDAAYGIVDDLQGELLDAYENMSEGSKDGSVGEARLEAASQLENISDKVPTLPDSVSGIQVVHYPLLRQNSRGDRANEAMAMLRAASKAIRHFRTNEGKLNKAEAKALDECSQQLVVHAKELETIV